MQAATERPTNIVFKYYKRLIVPLSLCLVLPLLALTPASILFSNRDSGNTTFPTRPQFVVKIDLIEALGGLGIQSQPLKQPGAVVQHIELHTNGSHNEDRNGSAFASSQSRPLHRSFNVGQNSTSLTFTPKH